MVFHASCTNARGLNPQPPNSNHQLRVAENFNTQECHAGFVPSPAARQQGMHPLPRSSASSIAHKPHALSWELSCARADGRLHGCESYHGTPSKVVSGHEPPGGFASKDPRLKCGRPHNLQMLGLPFAEAYVLFSPVGSEGNLSLDRFSCFPGIYHWTFF